MAPIQQQHINQKQSNQSTSLPSPAQTPAHTQLKLSLALFFIFQADPPNHPTN